MRFVLSVNQGSNVSLWLNGTKVMETTYKEIEDQCKKMEKVDPDYNCLTILKDVGVTVLNEDNEAYTITDDADLSPFYTDKSGRRVAGSDHSCAWTRAQGSIRRRSMATNDPLNHVTWKKKDFLTKVSTLALFRRSLSDKEIESLFYHERSSCDADKSDFFHAHRVAWDQLEFAVCSCGVIFWLVCDSDTPRLSSN